MLFFLSVFLVSLGRLNSLFLIDVENLCILFCLFCFLICFKLKNGIWVLVKVWNIKLLVIGGNWVVLLIKIILVVFGNMFISWYIDRRFIIDDLLMINSICLGKLGLLLFRCLLINFVMVWVGFWVFFVICCVVWFVRVIW